MKVLDKCIRWHNAISEDSFFECPFKIWTGKHRVEKVHTMDCESCNQNFLSQILNGSVAWTYIPLNERRRRLFQGNMVT